jgi:hypothetical protein
MGLLQLVFVPVDSAKQVCTFIALSPEEGKTFSFWNVVLLQNTKRQTKRETQ